MEQTFSAATLSRDILKMLYMHGALEGEKNMSGLFLLSVLLEKNSPIDGDSLLPRLIEVSIDELTTRAFVKKVIPDPYDYEVSLTTIGRKLVEGRLPQRPDIQIPDIET